MDYFADFSLKGFWKKDDEGFIETQPTDAEILAFEESAGDARWEGLAQIASSKSKSTAIVKAQKLLAALGIN